MRPPGPPRLPLPRLQSSSATALRPGVADGLRALMTVTRFDLRVERDPIRYPRGYRERGDVEIAAIFAAMLAYGQVDVLIRSVGKVMEIADHFGGPLACALAPPKERAEAFRGLVYRWNRGEDFALLFAALGAAIVEYGSVEALFASYREPGPRALASALDGGVAWLEAAARRAGAELGWGDEVRLRAWFARPAAGSACKRWCMAMRWLVRPAHEGVDLHLWRSFSPADLVLPLDVHTLRISRWLGLTGRRDGSWRTAEEVTAALRSIDPEDPVRFDFALAHLGISGLCRGYRHPDACPQCPLERCCEAPSRAP